MPTDLISIAFITLCCLYALRGAALSLISTVQRLVSLLAGYMTAYCWHESLATTVQQKWLLQLPSTILQLCCSVLLFISTLLLVRLLMRGLILLLRHSSQYLNQRLAQKTWLGRMSGASINAAIAAALFIFGLSVYQIASTVLPLPQLQETRMNARLLSAADYLGQQITRTVLQYSRDSSAGHSQSNTNITLHSSSISRQLPLQVIAKNISTTAIKTAPATQALATSHDSSRSQPTRQSTESTESNRSRERPNLTPSATAEQSDWLARQLTAEPAVQTRLADATDTGIAVSSNHSEVSQRIQNLIQDSAVREKMTDQLSQLLADKNSVKQMITQLLTESASSPQYQELLESEQSNQMITERFEHLLHNPEALQQALDSAQGQQLLQHLLNQ